MYAPTTASKRVISSIRMLSVILLPLQHSGIGRSYRREEWGKIPWDHMTVSDRHSIKQVPNWVRRAMGREERFVCGHERHLPWEVETALNEILEPCPHQFLE